MSDIKNEFIEFLMSATPEEINKFISEKGKKPNKPLLFTRLK